MGERQENEEDSTDGIDSDDDTPAEFGAQGRVEEQKVKPLREGHQEHEQEDWPPAAEEGDNREEDDRSNDERLIPESGEPRGQDAGHRGANVAGIGGNVWESNPPRTSKTPDRRI